MAACSKVSATSRRALKQRIERYVARWRRVLGLTDWAVRIEYNDELPALAQCAAVTSNEDATLYFNLRRVVAEVLPWPAGALEELVLHELVHCVIWPCSERAVNQITRSLLRVQRR